MISGSIVPFMCWRRLLRNAYKGGLYLRARLREVRVCENVKRRRERGAAAHGSSPAAICSRVCELGVE